MMKTFRRIPHRFRDLTRKTARSVNRELSSLFEDSVAAFINLVSRQDKRNRVLIFDDIFPQMLSAFRIAEYNTYLEKFSEAQIYSTAKAFPLVGETRTFEEVVREYENRYPQHRGKVLKYTPLQDLRCGVLYTIFLENAFKFIEFAERSRSAFVFTLYPGGGFRLGDSISDRKLRRVLSSACFRKVIVTQKITYEYLQDKGFCRPDQIEFIYGGVLPSQMFNRDGNNKHRFPQDKKNLDICFVANKYIPRGVDKGYDTFIEVANLLSSVSGDMVFHVVGPFDKSDIDVGQIHDKIHFHGMKYSDFFPNFYDKMDIILSPNKPFILNPGSFDGFPTGACVEAGLGGVAVFCTDLLQQNIMFQDGKEIVIIQPNAQDICDKIMNFYQKPEKLHRLSVEGQQVFRRVFDLNAQMEPRLNLISNYINGNLNSRTI